MIYIVFSLGVVLILYVYVCIYTHTYMCLIYMWYICDIYIYLYIFTGSKIYRKIWTKSIRFVNILIINFSEKKNYRNISNFVASSKELKSNRKESPLKK